MHHGLAAWFVPQGGPIWALSLTFLWTSEQEEILLGRGRVVCFGQPIHAYFQQLVILILQLLPRMRLPHSSQQHLHLFLPIGRKGIEDMVLLLSIDLGLEPFKQFRCVLILLHPGQDPTSHNNYSESSKFWSLFKSALEKIVWAYFYNR